MGAFVNERRKIIRRQADRELLERVAHLQAAVDRRGAAEPDDLEHKRRHIIRHNCKVRIDMVIRHSSGFLDTWSADVMSVKGRLLDLSAGGASLFTRQGFEIGQELRLAVLLPDESPIAAKSEVRWVRSLPEKHGHASGVQFVEISCTEQKRIERFLAKLDATAGL